MLFVIIMTAKGIGLPNEKLLQFFVLNVYMPLKKHFVMVGGIKP